MTSEKMAVFAPMPNASESTATAEVSGVASSARTASRRSCMTFSCALTKRRSREVTPRRRLREAFQPSPPSGASPLTPADSRRRSVSGSHQRPPGGRAQAQLSGRGLRRLRGLPAAGQRLLAQRRGAHAARPCPSTRRRCSGSASARPSPSALRRACSSRAGAARSDCRWYDLAASSNECAISISAWPRMMRACFSRAACASRDIASCSAPGMTTSRISTDDTVTPHGFER